MKKTLKEKKVWKKPSAKQTEEMIQRVKNIVAGSGIIIMAESDVTEKTGGIDIKSKCTVLTQGIPKRAIVSVLVNLLEQLEISPFDLMAEKILS